MGRFVTKHTTRVVLAMSGCYFQPVKILIIDVLTQMLFYMLFPCSKRFWCGAKPVQKRKQAYKR